jgi:hypothetical protein
MLRASGLDRLLFPTGLLAFSGLPLNTLTAMGLTAVFVTACCLYDLVTRGRVHPNHLKKPVLRRYSARPFTLPIS